MRNVNVSVLVLLIILTLCIGCDRSSSGGVMDGPDVIIDNPRNDDDSSDDERDDSWPEECYQASSGLWQVLICDNWSGGITRIVICDDWVKWEQNGATIGECNP